MNLTIIITLLNDDAECRATIASLRATAPADLTILVIDDCSDQPFAYAGDDAVRVVRNKERVGCAPSRHLGAALVTTPYLMFTDAHMRFEEGWFGNLQRKIASRPDCCWNGTCLGLGEGRMDLAKFRGLYTGARMNLFGVDKNKPTFKQVMEAQWAPHKDDEEVAAFMGAVYVLPKKVYDGCGGLTGLRKWGGDEPYLSLRLWLSGYEIRQALDVRAGHKFRDKAPYTTHTWELTFNKLWMILTLFGDTDPAMFLVGRLKELTPEGDWKRCMAELLRQLPAILDEHARNKARFKHDLRWYCDKFRVPFPE
jgi:GT2 family glycosyltransferase